MDASKAADPAKFFGPILIDKTAPVCDVVVVPNPLPRTNALVNVWATVTVTDADSRPNGFKLLSVETNNSATAAADIAGFDVGTDDTTGQLRGTLGRTYTLTYQSFDKAGNASERCSARVTVR